MDGTRSLAEYAKLILENKSNPQMLAELHIEIAAKYAFLADIAKDLQIERAKFWEKKFEGEKSLSDTALEAKWKLTEGGQKEIRMKYELKSLQNLMGAIKTASVVNSIEAKNQW